MLREESDTSYAVGLQHNRSRLQQIRKPERFTEDMKLMNYQVFLRILTGNLHNWEGFGIRNVENTEN